MRITIITQKTAKIMQQLTQSQWQLRKEYVLRTGLKHMIQQQLKV